LFLSIWPQQLPSPISCVSRGESQQTRVIVGVIVGAPQQLPSPALCVSRRESHTRRVIVGVIVAKAAANAWTAVGAQQQLPPPSLHALRKASHTWLAIVEIAAVGAAQFRPPPAGNTLCANGGSDYATCMRFLLYRPPPLLPLSCDRCSPATRCYRALALMLTYGSWLLGASLCFSRIGWGAARAQ